MSWLVWESIQLWKSKGKKIIKNRVDAWGLRLRKVKNKNKNKNNYATSRSSYKIRSMHTYIHTSPFVGNVQRGFTEKRYIVISLALKQSWNDYKRNHQIQQTGCDMHNSSKNRFKYEKSMKRTERCPHRASLWASFPSARTWIVITRWTN